MKRLLAAAATLLFFIGGIVQAQDVWPTKPVTVIVPFGAGGNADVLARIFSDRLSQRLGQQFVIENRAGAGGSTGIAATARSAPDGYTIGIGTGSGLATNPVIFKEKLPYNADKDLTYLYNIASQPNLMVVHPSVPATTLPELIDWLKKNPGTAYGTSGVGTAQHLCGEMLMQAAGVQISAVAYRASNQIMQDLIGGQIKLACDNFSTAWEQVKVGSVRAVGVTSATRYSFLPDVAAFAETLPGFDVLAWFSFIAPAGTPKAITDKLIAEMIAIGKEPETLQKLKLLGVEPSGLAGAAFAAYAAEERRKLAPIIEKAGIKAP